jgi:hypothetical protein
MRDYIDELERRLTWAARTESEPGRAARIISKAGSPSIRGSLTAIAVAVVAIIALLSLSVGRPPRALAFPVLDRPATDAQAISSIVPLLVRNGADLGHARAITTSYGTGYVIPSADGSKLCLAAPDLADGYGEGCSPVDQARRQGLVLTMISPTTAELVAVLPTSASTPILRSASGTTTRLPMSDGVATTVVNTKATVTLQIGDYTSTIDLTPTGTCAPVAPRPGDPATLRRVRCSTQP